MDFFESRGVPWRKVTDPGVGLNADAEGSVARWDDSGAVEALLAARRRYWAEINGGLRAARGAAVPPLPDPDMYVDAVVEEDGGAADPAVEAEYAAALRDIWSTRARRAPGCTPPSCGTTSCRCLPAGTMPESLTYVHCKRRSVHVARRMEDALLFLHSWCLRCDQLALC